ncbi:hypothetical protein [Actinoplanes auranticolor]|uniref:Uncharacterized protein n=1 Tax=Actinoplanes auranticolor TaxID=47988 RepID=A0A919S7J2_9ACTN|nr:hypothetical protein [Actinoplanes auranticolor]GIM65990.1 hypothetical protein Aau02nite_21150 [Actinoplanes auranticolor]
MIGTILQTLSLVGVVFALYFASLQTRRLQKQVHIANLYSRYEAFHHANERYDAGLAMLFQRPDLRPYVLRRKPLDLAGEDLDRALIVADQMAGAVDHALRVGDRFPDDERGDWSLLAEEMARSPLFQAIVGEKPSDFPDLQRFFPHAHPPSSPVTQSDEE